MATTINGSIKLPDGTIPSPARVIFRCRDPQAGGTVIPAIVVDAVAATGAFSATLAGEAAGTTYAVTVEAYSPATGRMEADDLPDIVVTGTGSGVLQDYAVVPEGRACAYTLARGDTALIPVTLVDANRRPANITDSTVSGYLERGDVQTPVTVTVINAAGGVVQMTITAATSAALPVGAHTAVIILKIGARQTSVRGTINII